MAKTFLGKSIPKQQATIKHKRSFGSPRIFALLILPIVACGTLLALQKNTLLAGGVGERSTGNALTLAVADQQTTTTLADFTQWSQYYCNPQQVENAFFTNGSLNNLFPFVPNYLNGLDKDGNTINLDAISDQATAKTYCASPYWNRTVLYCYVYKGLALLNWLAEAVAILYTLYAGLMYMLGALNEKNVARAKAVLIATYSGLIIVLLARVLIYSVISATVTNSPYDILQQNGTNSLPAGIIPGINDTPTPSPPK